VIAECIAGRPEQAFAYYAQTSPAYRSAPQELYRMEPYVYAQMTAGRSAPRHGEGKNSWLTGTAAWSFVALAQWILGVRPEHDGLRIEPCLPASIPSAEVTRLFRGCRYRITVRNARRARLRLTVDGKPFASTVVPPGPPGSALDVVVES
jgi:cellobiose phosphorylase